MNKVIFLYNKKKYIIIIIINITVIIKSIPCRLRQDVRPGL